MDPEAVDRHIEQTLSLDDDALRAALEHSVARGLPEIAVSPAQGALLALIARSIGARRILEVGTLGGYSTIWLARALPQDGELVTLELRRDFAAVARENVDRAGVGERVDIRVGPALDTITETGGPFDLVFIDADKVRTPEYFAHALERTRVGGVIIGDNVVRGGALADPEASDESTIGMRRFVDDLAGEPRVEATVIQTVGAKGHDGFAYAVVVA